MLCWRMVSVRELFESRKFPCDFFPIDTTEVLRERVENAATTIRNNRGMLERVEESFRRCLHYCIDNNGGHFEYFVYRLVITLITS
jgi:hypothetical protein